MNPLQHRFRGPLGNEARFIQAATGAVLGTTTTRRRQASMARLVGTGKDPRYGKGEVFDVAKYAPGPSGAGQDELANTLVNPAYQELLDKKWATELDPLKDPGRTITQMADAKVSQVPVVLDPVDQAKMDALDINDAYAIVHTGDASAKAGDGSLKPESVQESQRDDARQFGATGDVTETVVEEESDEEPKPSGRRSGSGS